MPLGKPNTQSQFFTFNWTSVLVAGFIHSRRKSNTPGSSSVVDVSVFPTEVGMVFIERLEQS